MIGPGLIVTVENPDLFNEELEAVEQRTTLPAHIDLDLLKNVVGRAGIALFQAERNHELELLRGLFSDEEIARLANHFVDFEQAVPVAVSIRFLGIQTATLPHTMRVHVTFEVEQPPRDLSVLTQFWDLALATAVTVSARMLCLRCGAPMKTGQLICSHCGADEAAQVTPPAVVAKIQFY